MNIGRLFLHCLVPSVRAGQGRDGLGSALKQSPRVPQAREHSFKATVTLASLSSLPHENTLSLKSVTHSGRPQKTAASLEDGIIDHKVGDRTVPGDRDSLS